MTTRLRDSLPALVLYVCCSAPLLAQATWSVDEGPGSRIGAACAFDTARGETVWFGGNDGADSNETWIWNGTAWALRQPATRPSARSGAAMVWDSLHQRIVLFGGGSSSGVTMTDTWTWDGSNWTQLSVSGSAVPSASTRFLVHDPVRDRLVLLSQTFGDLGVSELVGSAWTNVAPFAPWPSSGTWGAATFDANTNRAVYLPITSNLASSTVLWRWNGTVWTSQTVTGGANQVTACLVQDPVAHRLLLVGGKNFSNTNTLLGMNAAGTAWLPLATGGPEAQTCGACYDTARNRVVLVGGAAVGTPVDSSVWEWAGSTWQRRTSTPPYARVNFTTAFDGTSNRTWLYGGASPISTAADLWSLSATGWRLEAPDSGGPGTLNSRRLVVDEARNEVLLLPGDTSTFVVWRWNGTWSTVAGPKPPPRSSAGVVYDRRRSRVVLFGGTGTGSVPLNDTWTWNGTTWTQLFPATAPPARSNPGMVYDVLRDRIVMCGGSAISGVDETWEFDGADWLLRAQGGAYPGVAGPAVVYDVARQTVVAVSPVPFGAIGSTLRTWQWDGSSWSELVLPATPASRTGAGFVPTADGVLLFGGQLSASGQLTAERRWLRTAQVAAVQSFGTPGQSSGGALELQVVGTGPWLGCRVDTRLQGLPTIALPALWAGASRTEWAGLTLPVDLAPVGWPGALVRIAPDLAVPMTLVGGGLATAAIDLPANPSLVGVELHLQALAYEPLSGALTTSNGLTFVAGLR